MNLLERTSPGMFHVKLPGVDPRTFAELLGMPFSSLLLLVKDHHEREPTVKSSIGESTSFTKLQEGYPVFFTHTSEQKQQNIVSLVPGGRRIGILDLYESLSSVIEVAACCFHAQSELYQTHRPENGQMSSTMDLMTL